MRPLPQLSPADLVKDQQALAVIRLGCAYSASAIGSESGKPGIRSSAGMRFPSLKHVMDGLTQVAGEFITTYVGRSKLPQAELQDLQAAPS